STASRSGDVSRARLRRAVLLFGLGALVGVLVWRFRGGLDTPRESAQKAATAPLEPEGHEPPVVAAPSEPPVAVAPSEPSAPVSPEPEAPPAVEPTVGPAPTAA